ncbi:hypothetical protein [Pedobacter sp. SYSU D00535]|uniref:hypothetical protein n=1 Tax=Pedobacter sp. SYSU D00535 TaxID=2810308 RepID=UPI001A97A5AA|nr:hypothetical protein [Pedobacter sp. SYSU D00535]
MSKSLSDELEDREYEVEEKPAYQAGMSYAIVSCLAIIPSLLPLPSSFAAVAAVIGLLQIIFFIQYWAKISWFKNVLRNDLVDTTDEE